MKYYLTEDSLVYILRQLKEKNNETFVSKNTYNEDIAKFVDVDTVGKTTDLHTNIKNNIVGSINELHTELDDKANTKDVKQINLELGSLESKVEENTSRIEEYSMIEEPDIEFIIADLENE